MISPDFFQVLVYGVVGLFLWFLFSDLLYKSNYPRLPGPISFPLIGSAIQIGIESINTKNFQLMRKLCAKYGSVMGFKAGVQNFVFVEDYATAKHLLTSDDWSGRYPNKSLYLELTMDRNVGILFSRGEPWKKMRTFAIRSLIEFGFGETQNMELVLEEELDDFMIRLDERVSQSEAADISFHQYFNLPVLNILWRVMCGFRFSCDDEEMKKLVPIIEAAISSTSIGTQPIYAFPFLRYIPTMSNQKQLVDMFGQVQGIFWDMIDRRRKSGTYLDVQNDFVDKFMKKIEEYRSDGISTDVYTDEQLVQSCTDLVLAGSDTSANALEFCMLYMLKYPHIQENVQKEIDVTIGPTTRPCVNDKYRMPYTEATIMEVLRFANIAPVDVRTSIRDTKLCGSFVSKDTFALVNFTQIHKDPRIWEDPEEFRPSRFFDENNNLMKDNKLLVFGGGKRVCLGKQMAKSSIFVFLTTILQRYTLEPSPNHPEISLESFVSGITNMPSKFHCRLRLREGASPLKRKP